MSNLNSLLESSNQWKSMQSDAARLASKWNKTGLLEGLGSETEKNNMSLILENQAKQLVVESSQTGAGVAGVDGVEYPAPVACVVGVLGVLVVAGVDGALVGVVE